MFIGISAYYVYIALKKAVRNVRARESVSAVGAGIAGSMTNTVLVFLMLYLVYAQRVVEVTGAGFKAIVITVFTTNAIAEAVVSALITTAIVLALKRYKQYNTVIEES